MRRAQGRDRAPGVGQEVDHGRGVEADVKAAARPARGGVRDRKPADARRRSAWRARGRVRRRRRRARPWSRPPSSRPRDPRPTGDRVAGDQGLLDVPARSAQAAPPRPRRGRQAPDAGAAARRCRSRRQVEKARVDAEVRALADDVSEGLTRPWVRRSGPRVGVAAARAGRPARRCARRHRPGVAKIPWWAGLVRVLQWLLILAALGGAGWLVGAGRPVLPAAGARRSRRTSGSLRCRR